MAVVTRFYGTGRRKTSVARVWLRAGNGRILAYLSAHAEVYHQEFHEGRVTVRCYLPRYLVRHLKEPGVEVKMLEASAERNGLAERDENDEGEI